ncbi:hypothetical protein D5S17_19490 [Pseudonocardiaceae bacterium YIM PH 21723]|nr:hypothetical protein D5S17_19490 [Pseudonocardiaceae bacterium YIM PH 21723]
MAAGFAALGATSATMAQASTPDFAGEQTLPLDTCAPGVVDAALALNTPCPTGKISFGVPNADALNPHNLVQVGNVSHPEDLASPEVIEQLAATNLSPSAINRIDKVRPEARVEATDAFTAQELGGLRIGPTANSGMNLLDTNVTPKFDQTGAISNGDVQAGRSQEDPSEPYRAFVDGTFVPVMTKAAPAAGSLNPLSPQLPNTHLTNPTQGRSADTDKMLDAAAKTNSPLNAFKAVPGFDMVNPNSPSNPARVLTSPAGRSRGDDSLKALFQGQGIDKINPLHGGLGDFQTKGLDTPVERSGIDPVGGALPSTSALPLNNLGAGALSNPTASLPIGQDVHQHTQRTGDDPIGELNPSNLAQGSLSKPTGLPIPATALKGSTPLMNDSTNVKPQPLYGPGHPGNGRSQADADPSALLTGLNPSNLAQGSLSKPTGLPIPATALKGSTPLTNDSTDVKPQPLYGPGHPGNGRSHGDEGLTELLGGLGPIFPSHSVKQDNATDGTEGRSKGDENLNGQSGSVGNMNFTDKNLLPKELGALNPLPEPSQSPLQNPTVLLGGGKHQARIHDTTGDYSNGDHPLNQLGSLLGKKTIQ